VTRVVLTDDDELFRESLGLNLADEGYDVVSFANGRDTLSYLEDGGAADVLLLDWRMPELNGLDVLRHLRRSGIEVPVIFLTVLSDDIYEQAALEGGAVDFIDKSRRLPILLKRVELIADGLRSAAKSDPSPSETFRHGALELRFQTHRAFWAGSMVDLSLTEFRIIALLAGKAGEDIGYREIYDLVHGKDFVAGNGEEGYRTNVRSLVKRIRKAFRDVDPEFAQIENYAGFGYRWIPEE
jgi:two-component system, OmpR family, response regulator ChvI